uniref:Dynamin GTPase n=1 Tax=Chromera velia CCMP2878 TaxID=1169474 RepID=A0A0G4GH60_9ALVE|eukprot:Cvel_21909.t1-p1 / transcript=Cvel_21909.t1 / gene=Cvel_21909 / organism=Chromera_velia_CCMP2878 / gene_product=Dynamin-A, putative / transcript_product=Dynamin-A, putative / location=Cvel_scaffold2099:21413-29234(-) / protein_length=909 / sequence_SO=supercontig / SO=protein_coding / is_pseudo=false
MNQLIPIINRLQDVLLSVGVQHTGIDLPQIAVVGAQSVGKSSVLEALVGRDFLPRGSGIVTRRPIVLQLRNVKGEKEWGEFGHNPSQKYEDFEMIRKEIERETERITGRNKGISAQPIFLKISSPYVIDLTLIDLPGITKVPIGDQPTDIEHQVRKMIMSFILKPNCIILAVSAANTDLANSDGLKFARDVDPEGMRTIGVLTKVDLVDDDTHTLEMLQGKVYPLRLGYVAVVCRGAKDVQGKKTIRDGLKEEEQFFKNHEVYRHVYAANKCGTQHLAQMLNKVLMYHIRDALPELRNRIASLLHETETELERYGDPLTDLQSNPGALLLHFFSRFARNVQDHIDGKIHLQHPPLDDLRGVGSRRGSASHGVIAAAAAAASSSRHYRIPSLKPPVEMLTGGARLRYIFHDWFGRAVAEFDPLAGLTDNEIRVAIRNSTGPKASLFVPEGAFELLVKKQIAKLERPALQCVDQVYEELQKIVEMCELAEMARYSNLRNRILEVVRGVLRKCLQPTSAMICNLVQVELAYINTNHPDFMGGAKTISTILGRHHAPQTPQPGHAQYSRRNKHHHSAGGTQSGPNGYLDQDGETAARPRSSSPRHESVPGPTGNGRGSGAGGAISNGHPQPSGGGSKERVARHRSAGSDGEAERGDGSGPHAATVAAANGPASGGLLGFLNRGPFGNFSQTGAGGQSQSHQQQPQAQSMAMQQQQGGNPGGGSQQIQQPGEVPLMNGFSHPPDTPGLQGRAFFGGPDAQAAQAQMAASQPSYPQQGTPMIGALASASTTASNGTIRLPQVPTVIAPSASMSERERLEVDLIKSLISCYFCIVKRNLADSVPKSIMFFMVNTTKEVVQRELVAQLYREELFPELLKEADDISEKRAKCKTMATTLQNAMDILNQIREYNVEGSR